MKEIELVVRISEEDLDCIKYLKAKGWASKHELQILNGTPLPKGHGRLIDADAVDTRYSDPEVIETLNQAPTIIEADTESEDKE